MVKEVMERQGHRVLKAARVDLVGRMAQQVRVLLAVCMVVVPAKRDLPASPQHLAEAELFEYSGPEALELSHLQMFVPQTTRQEVLPLQCPELILG
jgi:hypothetical protein